MESNTETGAFYRIVSSTPTTSSNRPYRRTTSRGPRYGRDLLLPRLLPRLHTFGYDGTSSHPPLHRASGRVDRALRPGPETQVDVGRNDTRNPVPSHERPESKEVPWGPLTLHWGSDERRVLCTTDLVGMRNGLLGETRGVFTSTKETSTSAEENTLPPSVTSVRTVDENLEVDNLP